MHNTRVIRPLIRLEYMPYTLTLQLCISDISDSESFECIYAQTAYYII